MEHWQKVTIGTIGGLVATVIFYLIVGRLLDYFYIQKKKRRNSAAVARPERFYSKKRGSMKNSELERFIHEEFESSRHEVIVVVASTDKRSAAVCAFLQEMKVEFFLENFPECCLQHLASTHSDKQANFDQAGLDHEATLRSVLTAVSFWSSKWEFADSINLLSQNQRFVIEANDGESSSAKFLKQFEEKFEFRVFTQWTDNYVCDHSANDEMWESLIDCTKRLLRVDEDTLASDSGLTSNETWLDFVCDQWPRSRVRVNGLNFHQLPHPGQVSPDHPKTEEKLIEFE